MLRDHETDTATATLEFETKEDVLAALTRNGRSLDGNSIEIKAGTGTILWVTNYPPEADERFMRDMFEPVGSSRAVAYLVIS